MKIEKHQAKKLSEILQKEFGFGVRQAEEEANTIITYLDSKPYRWVSVSEKLPTPVLYPQPSAPYYLVKTENFGEQRCMYLTDIYGNNGWYTSYITKLVVPVLEWQD